MTNTDDTASLLNDMARILRETTNWLPVHSGGVALGREADAVLERYDAWKEKQ